MRHPTLPPRWITAFAVVLALVASALLAPARPAHAADVLLSQGKTATASSVENAGTPASAAVDGSTGTRWASAAADPQWLMVDLGASATVTKVVLNWESAYGTAFRIQVSASGTGGWTDVYSTTTGPGGNQTLTVSGTGRFVRLYGSVRANGYGYSLWEFQVFGPSDDPPAGDCGSANAALSKPATASSTENAGTPAASAFDGNAGTRWASAATDPQWVQVDLGASATVCKVVLNWESAYGTAFRIQVSASGTGGWTDLYSTITGTGGTQTLTVAGTGRYVRLTGTARATGYGYSLWEFAVH
ncbi:MAG: discoidin domain-containing protein, partial [Streptosporangiaceae bacterium]